MQLAGHPHFFTPGLVSSLTAHQVYSQSVEDRMERLGMAARVAQLQMSATEDDQVRQRQDAVRGSSRLSRVFASWGDSLPVLSLDSYAAFP